MLILLIAGLLGGLASGFFKLGWEILLPPRTPERNETNPPQYLLQQIGFSEQFTHRYFLFSGQRVQYISLLMHFGFSIFFSFIYIIASAQFSFVSLGQGSLYGVFIWAIFHLIILPTMHTVPPIKNQPLAEHFSELLGHAIWGFMIQVCYVYVLALFS